MVANKTDEEKQSRRIHLFNCDHTYDLDVVETFLLETKENFSFDVLVVKHYFSLDQTSKMRFTTIPKLQMDCAVFVVHANESRLSINEDSAGIGYANIYKALQQATDGKVLIIIGGDDNYRDEHEKNEAYLSRWSRRKISSQFDRRFIDGTKSFVFSWDKKHRPIHKEAMCHWLDPGKAEQKFASQRSGDVLVSREEEGTSKTLEDRCQEDQENLEKNSFPEELIGAEHKQMFDSWDELAELASEGVSSGYSQGTVLLETHMRFGNISYEEQDLVSWDHKWHPPDKVERDLEWVWGSTPEAMVRFVAGRFGVHQHVVNLTPLWLRPFIYMYDLGYSLLYNREATQ